MSRYNLTDFEWRVIAPLLPNKPRECRVATTGAYSTVFSECCTLVYRGVVCPSTIAQARHVTAASYVGDVQGCETG